LRDHWLFRYKSGAPAWVNAEFTVIRDHVQAAIWPDQLAKRALAMSIRSNRLRAMTWTAGQASSDAALVRLKVLARILGGLLLLSTP